MLEEKFYTTDQVAKMLQVHPFTILKFIKQGKLNGIKLGRVYRIKEADIKTFINERSTAKPQASNKEVQKEEKEEIEQKRRQPSNKEDNDHYYII